MLDRDNIMYVLQKLQNSGIAFSIEYNDHKLVYDSTEDAVRVLIKQEEITEDEGKLMIDNDCIVKIQLYPNTPVGCWVVYSYSIEKALENIFEEEE